MITKEVIFILCFTIILGISAQNDKASENGDNHKFYSEKTEKLEKKHWKKFRDPAEQFEKDYKRWEDKKYVKHDKRAKSHSMEINEIDSNEYIDKFNKYGNTFNPNFIHVNNEKTNYHEKRASDDKRHEHEPEHENEKPGDLLHDININYIKNNKKVSGDSELITEKMAEAYKSKENYQENYQNGNGLYMKRFKKDFYSNLNLIDLTNPPPHNDTIRMARYIVHTVDWAALGTLSARAPTKGAPFVCVKATSDGMVNASSGVPFFYMSPMDLCTQDLQKDNRVSVLVTLSETEYCKNQQLDPQDPRCAKLTLSGKIKKIKPGSEEEKFAKDALFSRHPAMATWPANHNWYFSKLKIGQIILLDYFGGATYIKVKDYLNGGPVELELKK